VATPHSSSSAPCPPFGFPIWGFVKFGQSCSQTDHPMPFLRSCSSDSCFFICIVASVMQYMTVRLLILSPCARIWAISKVGDEDCTLPVQMRQNEVEVDSTTEACNACRLCMAEGRCNRLPLASNGQCQDIPQQLRKARFFTADLKLRSPVWWQLGIDLFSIILSLMKPWFLPVSM